MNEFSRNQRQMPRRRPLSHLRRCSKSLKLSLIRRRRRRRSRRRRQRRIKNQNGRLAGQRRNLLQVIVCQKNFRTRRNAEVPPRRRRQKSPTKAPQPPASLCPGPDSNRRNRRKKRQSKPRPPSRLRHQARRVELSGSLCYARLFLVTSLPVPRSRKDPSVPELPLT